MATTIINSSPTFAPPPKQIRFINNQGNPPSKRRRINAACLTCRRRKTRCAGERPLCSTCTKNGHVCLGYPEDKKESNESRDDEHDDGQHAQQEDGEDGAGSKRIKLSSTVSLVEGERHASPSLNSQTEAHHQTHITTPSPGMLPNVRASNSPALSTIYAPTSPMTVSAPTHASYISHTSHPDDPDSPTARRNPHRASSHRVPYFRYFGPTAIVPGFKQMVVSVRDRRRSMTGSHSGGSPFSNPSGITTSSVATESDIVTEDPPMYDSNDPNPVHPLIISLAKTFFAQLGCNYPFLSEHKFMPMLTEKRVEPILVDAVCALAARFSDSPILAGTKRKTPRTERGHVYARRARQSTVDTFPCPTVSAVQACLLMAYEGFGASQDSALWMYLGLAIRMALDLGLQKRIGIHCQGDQDPWASQQYSQAGNLENPPEQRPHVDGLSQEEQKELEQERIDTFWAVFVLDRVISSGTGRPVTLRDDDFELAFPEPVLNPVADWPTPFPILLEIIHLHGRVSDLLNNIQNVSDLNQEKWQKLMAFESRLTKVYKNWDSRLQFNVINFRAYLSVGQGPTFILLHFWFHALFIILHQPTLMTPFADMRSDFQLLPDSRELSMSSAKTICDILAFADLIDPKSLVSNPFTSQPMYIAACAFLMESSASSSREAALPPKQATTSSNSKKSKHSLLASAATQNYQRCYSSLENLHTYWGGVKYILTALDQKAKGIWDCETFTSEEFQSTKPTDQEDFDAHLKLNAAVASPNLAGPPIAWSLAGTTNSPSSSMTLMYQNWNAGLGMATPQSLESHHSISTSGQSVNESIRQATHVSSGMPPPSIRSRPQASTLRGSPQQQVPKVLGKHDRRPMMALDNFSEATPNGGSIFMPPSYTPSSQHSNGFEGYNASPANTMAESHSLHMNGVGSDDVNNDFYFSNGMPYQAVWGSNPGEVDAITFDSQDIDIGSLGLHQTEMIGPWLDYMPQDVLGLFDHQGLGNSGHGVG